jgi:hypothetical protein
VIRQPRTIGQEWFLVWCRSSPPSRGRP